MVLHLTQPERIYIYGQVSSIYAHQGLMNSIGHRKNILNDTFKILGVGVDFNDEKQPFGQKIILVNVFGMEIKG